MELCVLFLGAFLIMEYQFYRTCITPFFIIGLIYFCSIPFINVLGPWLGYYEISNTSMGLFSLYLAILFLCDIPCKLYKNNPINDSQKRESLFIKHQELIWYIFCVMLLGYALSLVQAIGLYGLENIKGKSGGIFGHMGLFCLALSPMIVYIFAKAKKIRYMLGIIVLYVVLFLFGVKSYIFISIITSCILICFEKRVTLGSLLKIGLILISLALVTFLLIYGVLPILRGGISEPDQIVEVIRDAFEHLFYYFASPFLGSNTYFMNPIHNGLDQGMRVLFAPIVSLYEAFVGEQNYPTVIMDFWAPISADAHRTHTNVGGMFSEAVYHVGYVWTGMFVLCIGLYCSLFNFARRVSIYFHMSASLAISLLALCFFCNYFTLLSVLEIVVYSFVIEYILLILDKKSVRIVL